MTIIDIVALRDRFDRSLRRCYVLLTTTRLGDWFHHPKEDKTTQKGEANQLRVMILSPEVLLFTLIVLFIGFVLGRWWAEANRARYDMQRTWKNRKNYRDG
jgi:hypothetical protein